MLWAYMDETGIHDKGSGRYKHLVVGGAIAEYTDWQTLESHWRAALSDEQISEFHMSHFEAYDHEFKDWTEARPNAFLNRLLDIIHKSHIRACFAAGTLAPNKQTGRTWFPVIYKKCVQRMIHDLLWYADEEREIRAVFAKHHEIDHRALAYYYKAISKGLTHDICIATDSPKTCVALQVADFVVYEAARWLNDPNHPVIPSRFPLRNLYGRGMSIGLKVAV